MLDLLLKCASQKCYQKIVWTFALKTSKTVILQVFLHVWQQQVFYMYCSNKQQDNNFYMYCSNKQQDNKFPPNSPTLNFMHMNFCPKWMEKSSVEKKNLLSEGTWLCQFELVQGALNCPCTKGRLDILHIYSCLY